MTAPPRVLIVSDDQWPRALVRAEMEAGGWDAVGAPDLRWAARALPDEPGRGPVRLVILAQDAAGDAAALEALRALHPSAPILLLGHRVREPPAGPWAEVLRRPVSVGEVVAAAARLAG